MRTLLMGAAMVALLAPGAMAQTSGDPASAGAATETAMSEFLVFFEFDDASLTSAGQAVVADAAAAYQRTGMAQVTVTGYADRSGTEAYNYDLSMRRARTVEAELERLGVPVGEISVRAEGENNPRVATADGVREAANRRVEIIVPQPSAPMAAATAPTAAEPAWSEPMAERRWELAVGGVYGNNYGETDEDTTSNLAGAELTLGYALAPNLMASLEQSALYSFNATDEGWGGRTVAGLDFQLSESGFRPYIGVNAGGAYGKSIQDGFVVGPELGVKLDLAETTFLYGKASYDYQLRNSDDLKDGIALVGAGIGMRF